MKTWVFGCVCVLVFGLTVVALANDEGDQYDMMYMKPAIAANMAMQKAVMGGDLGAAATDAGNLQAAFAKIEAFWTEKHADDAVMFAKNIQKAAEDTKTAAMGGDKDATAAAAKMVAANCGGCHMAHRTRTANGFDLH
jgi:cytochrome c556